jgi:hypothetical protein
VNKEKKIAHMEMALTICVMYKSGKNIKKAAHTALVTQ